ncbi:delta-sterol C-methyltransferase [Mycena sanguinolenta]|nr:delta-sterol C-methyltransferase [Mycena sanguinolenta]
MTDGRVGERLASYGSFWGDSASNEGKVEVDTRLENYTTVVNGYYDGATELYEYGWSQSFHFSRFYKGEAFAASLARHEHYLAHRMRLSPGMRVLDVGCGVGGPARQIGRFAGVNIVGVNNNDFQIGKARKYAQEAGMQDQLTFVKADFMNLSKQFPENSFDAVYAIEATCHAPSFEGIYGEIFKVLKPNGVFGLYEWVMTDDWDPSIPAHKEIAHGIEFGSGIPEMRPISAARKALHSVGFTVEHDEDLAEHDDPVRWFYPLQGDIRKAQTAWDFFTVLRISWAGQLVSHTAMAVMEFLGILPKGTCEVASSMQVAADALILGGQTKLFTPMYLAICRKPMP